MQQLRSRLASVGYVESKYERGRAVKSRIVYPAASFQPPETCTEHAECQAGQASSADLCRAAQDHYDKVSTAAHEWHSAVPKAIDAYFNNTEHARLKDAVVEAAIARKLLDRTFHNNMDVDEYETAMARYDELEAVYDKAVDALLAFEAEHQLTSTPKGAAP